MIEHKGGYEVEAMETDKLTKLFTEKFLDVGLENELLRAKRFGRDLCLLRITPEMPPKVRQDMLYRILKELAKYVRMHTRSIDTKVRMADGVLVILPETSLEGAKRVVEKIREQMEPQRFLHQDSGTEFSVRLKYSFAVFPHDGKDKESLIEYLKKGAYSESQAQKISQEPAGADEEEKNEERS